MLRHPSRPWLPVSFAARPQGQGSVTWALPAGDRAEWASKSCPAWGLLWNELPFEYQVVFIKSAGGRIEMFCLFYLSFLHLCPRLTNPSDFGSLTVSHLILRFSSLDPFSLSKQSCAPHWAKIRNVEGKERERLVWKIPSAFINFHRASRLLWRLPGPEASASLGLLMWLVANDCKKGDSPSWTQQSRLWPYHSRVCLVQF